MYVTAINDKKRSHKFEKVVRGLMGGFGKRKGKKDMML